MKHYISSSVGRNVHGDLDGSLFLFAPAGQLPCGDGLPGPLLTSVNVEK